MSTTPQPLYLSSPSHFHIRPATPSDFPSMTDVLFHSFNAPFWTYLMPDDAPHRAWWNESFRLSYENLGDRQFVVEDLVSEDKKIVAFSRWQVPQRDGVMERWWPEMREEQWDMELVDAFFGGMESNRKDLMDNRPHWMIELLGTHEAYQNRGIAASLLKWGTDQADAAGLETYLDGSAKGQPYYTNRHGFKAREQVPIPDREAYGSYTYVSMVRSPKAKGGAE